MSKEPDIVSTCEYSFDRLYLPKGGYDAATAGLMRTRVARVPCPARADLMLRLARPEWTFWQGDAISGLNPAISEPKLNRCVFRTLG